MLLQILVSLFLAVLIAYVAYRVGSLDFSGAIAAAVLGTVVFGLGGLRMAGLLVVFFITSSGLSRLFRSRKKSVEENFAKGHRRDAGQVLANGGASGMFIILAVLFPTAPWLWIAAAASLAAANADTWATELGVLNPAPPRLVTTCKVVERGTSGAISPGGTLAALSGSGLIALIAASNPAGAAPLFTSPFPPPPLNLPLLAVILLAGLCGSLVDSLLGATLQAIYFCPTCAKETERHPVHGCGSPTILRRGLPWLNNDWVNAACTLSAGLIAGLLALPFLPTF